MSNGSLQATLQVGDRRYRWDPRVYSDLSRPVTFGADAPEAFGLPRPRIEPALFASVECATVHDLNPHTTTHLETSRHIRELGCVIDPHPESSPAPGPHHGPVRVRGRIPTYGSTPDPPHTAGPAAGAALDRFHFLATVASIEPSRREDGHRAVTALQIEDTLDPASGFLEAFILRTLPNGPEKIHRRYTGTDPPCVEAAAAGRLRAAGVRLLLVDLPSLDPETDGGALAAHRAFFEPPSSGRKRPVGPPAPATRPDPAGPPESTRVAEGLAVCELIYVPPELEDGIGLLHLVPLPWDLDASPVRPIFHPLVEC